MEINRKARLIELGSDRKGQFLFSFETIEKPKKREWRDKWHGRKCYTLGDVLALDPENAEALRHMAQMDRFELRYKRWIVNETKVCH